MELKVDTASNMGSGSSDNQSAIMFHTWGNGIANSREVMRIDSKGDVGIGKTSPSYTLDVAGDINFTGTLRHNGNEFSGGSGGSSKWSGSTDIYYTSGDVGIGTTSPTKKLDVRGNIRLGDGTTLEQDINIVSKDGNWQVGTNNSTNSDPDTNQFYIYDTEYRLTIQKGTGNIGIGITPTDNKLTVKTGTNYDGINVVNENNYALFRAGRGTSSLSVSYMELYDGSSSLNSKVYISTVMIHTLMVVTWVLEQLHL